MNEKRRMIKKDEIFWASVAFIFFLGGVLGFIIFPGCHENSCSYETSLGCYSLIILSSGLIVIAFTILYYLFYLDDWIREKVANHRQKKISKAHYKLILKKLEEEEE